MYNRGSQRKTPREGMKVNGIKTIRKECEKMKKVKTILTIIFGVLAFGFWVALFPISVHNKWNGELIDTTLFWRIEWFFVPVAYLIWDIYQLRKKKMVK